MKGKKIKSGTVSNFEFETFRYGTEVLHRLRILGKVGLEERIDVYKTTLDLNPSSSYFCILDNSHNFENTVTYSDLDYLDKLLFDGGIRVFTGATITYDESFAFIVKLAQRSAAMNNLKCDLISTDNAGTAEEFVMSKLTNTLLANSNEY